MIWMHVGEESLRVGFGVDDGTTSRSFALLPLVAMPFAWGCCCPADGTPTDTGVSHTRGPGLRRGRRSSDELRLGDALDFWRVTAVDPPRRLELTAEMRLPRLAILSFDVDPAPAPSAGTRWVMTARFRPRGFLGIAYWYSVLPLHGIVVRGMLREIVRAAR